VVSLGQDCFSVLNLLIFEHEWVGISFDHVRQASLNTIATTSCLDKSTETFSGENGNRFLQATNLVVASKLLCVEVR